MRRLNLIRNHLSSKKTLSSFKSDLVQIESHTDKVKIVRLTNYSKLNALSDTVLEQLYEALLILERDDNTKVIILTGNDKVFCAGADISTLSNSTYSSILKYDYLQYIERISYEISKPVIAAVSGFCFGGGFELALTCDIIGTTKTTKFGFPEIKLGLFPGAGGTQRLTRFCGPYKASEIILSGDTYDADTMNRLNVINYVFPNYETLMNHTLTLAEKISNYSILALKTAKKAIKTSNETTLRQGLETERSIFYGLFSTEDKKIGTEAFIKKKKPSFVDK
jgi:enoyl-CoA hydratase/carnithine racemase